MGRKPRQRIHYMADANYLICMCDALEVDERRPPEWRTTAIAHLREVITMFSVDAQKIARAEAASNKGATEK